MLINNDQCFKMCDILIFDYGTVYNQNKCFCFNYVDDNNLLEHPLDYFLGYFFNLKIIDFNI